MVALILKITICHLLGDFVLQTNKMVEDIDTRKFKSKYLYFHILIHLVLLLIFTQFEGQYIFPVILLALAHLAIDALTKIVLKNYIKPIYNFLLDQVLHIISIAVFIRFFYSYEIDYALIFTPKNYLFGINIICITFVSSIIVKKIMEVFSYDMQNDGLYNAGKYIGMLERLFVFVFVITSFWEGIGFLLAAKSIFRFGDLKEKKEIKLTEYILIGTLLSFGIAMLIGVLYLGLVNFMN